MRESGAKRVEVKDNTLITKGNDGEPINILKLNLNVNHVTVEERKNAEQERAKKSKITIVESNREKKAQITIRRERCRSLLSQIRINKRNYKYGWKEGKKQ